MADTGYIFLVLALLASVLSTIAFIRGGRGRHQALTESGRHSLLAAFGWLSLAGGVLLVMLSGHDFQPEYVASYSNRALSVPYLISALWAGNTGALLFGVWLLLLCAVITLLRQWRNRGLVLHASVVMMAVQAVFIILLFSVPVMAADAGEGVIEGVLVNGTEDGGSVAGLETVLKTYTDAAETASETTIADDEGAFRFTGLSTDPRLVYQVSTDFQGATYSSELIVFGDEETTKPITITVYEPTSDDSVIKIASAQTIIYVEEGGLAVYEFVAFDNESDRTYVGAEAEAIGDKLPTLRFSLPAGASEPEIRAGLVGCCVFGTEYGFLHTMPVLPGRTEISFSYRMAVDPDEYTFLRGNFYPTSQYALIMQGDALEMEIVTQGLTEEEPIEFEGTSFVLFSAKGLVPGQFVTAQVKRTPSGGISPAVWAVLGLALAAGVSALLYSRRRPRPVAVASVEAGEAAEDTDVETLLREIARLDDDFEDGKIDGEEYHRLRDARKAQVIEFMKRPGRGDRGA